MSLRAEPEKHDFISKLHLHIIARILKKIAKDLLAQDEEVI